MTVVVADRVQEITSSGFAGTGAIHLNGVPNSPAGRVSFASGVGDGNQTVFLIDDNAGNWEISVGTLVAGSPHALSRDEVIASSAGGAKVNFTAGVKDVKLVASARRMAFLDSGGYLLDGDGAYLAREQYLTDTGVADAYVITPSPAITAYQAGQIFRVAIANANTGAATLNVNGLGAKAIKQGDGVSDPDADDVPAALNSFIYDGTSFRTLGAPSAKHRWRHGVNTNLTGTSVTFSGIPSGVSVIHVALHSASHTASSTPMNMRLGTSSGMEVSGYVDGAETGTAYTNSSGTAFSVTHHVPTSQSYSGLLTLARRAGNVWALNGGTTNGINQCIECSGVKELSGEITQLQLFPIGASWDNGAANIVYQ